MWISSRLKSIVFALAVTVPAGAVMADEGKRFLLRDTEMLLTINMKQIMNSEMVRSARMSSKLTGALLEELLTRGPELRCLKDAGVDICRDLETLTYVRSRTATVLVIKNAPAVEKLASPAMRGTFVAIEVRGVRLYEAKMPGKSLYICRVDPGTLVVSSARDNLLECLSYKGKKSPRSKPFQPSNAMDGKASIRFAATSFALAALLPSVPNSENLGAALRVIDGVSGTLTVNKEIDLDVGIHVKDERIARKIAPAGNAVLATLRTHLKDSTIRHARAIPLAEILQHVHINHEGAVISVQVRANLDTIDRLMQTLPR
jgi:hypothetical protein